MTHRYKMQVAEDVVRDGLGVELLNETGDVVAEIFRSDREHTVLVNIFSYDIPLAAIELLIARAKDILEPFENGMTLSEAILTGPKLVRPPESDGGA